MSVYRLSGSRPGYKDVQGELHEDRFMIPEGLARDKVCLFSVVDLEDLQRRMYATETDWDVRANFFGVSWENNDDILTQLFGYRTASPREMEIIASSVGKDEGGYFYICYKSPLHSDKKRLLPDISGRESGAESVVLGWEHHSSRYFPYANEEAMIVTYSLAEEFGRQQAKNLGREFEVVIQDRDITWALGEGDRREGYKNKRPKAFSPEQLRNIRLR